MNRHHKAPHGLRALIMSAIFFTLIAPLAHAQVIDPVPKVLKPNDNPQPDPDQDIQFDSWGYAVSLLGGRAVVAAPHLTTTGGAYIFEQSGPNWIQKQHLYTPHGDPQRHIGMGELIEQDDTSILISDASLGSGAAYYFQKSASGDFRATATLHGGGPRSFARSIAMSGCFIAIGSDADPIVSAVYQGGVHLYDKCGGNPVYVGSLYASGAFPGDQFSYSIALLGYEMMVGAPGMEGGAGAVFYYTYTGTKWILRQKIVQAHPAPGNHFGSAVSFRNGLAVIGAPDQPDIGQTEIFKRGSNGAWTSLGLLSPPSVIGGSAWSGFGRKLTVTPDYVVIAGISKPEERLAARVFVYKRAGDVLSFQGNLPFLTADSFSNAAISLSVSGQGLIVGNPQAMRHGFRIEGVVTISQLPH